MFGAMKGEASEPLHETEMLVCLVAGGGIELPTLGL